MGSPVAWSWVLVVLIAGSVAVAQREPVRVIFDTDIQSDVDDVGAVALLHALADLGEAEIVAMGVSVTNPDSPLCLDALNTWYGRPDIPIGVVKGKGVKRGSSYAGGIAKEFPHRLKSADDAPDAAQLYRKVLASQPDASVVLVTVGFLTNVANLLRTKPDKPDGLNGVELVRRKVKVWVCMGGQFPEGRECNLIRDPAATAYAIEHWPTPIVFTGWEIGNRIVTGARLKQTAKGSPVRRAYELYNGLKGRQSWDQTAVLYAVRGLGEWWSLQREGHLAVDAKGGNVWRKSPDKPHVHLVEKMAPEQVARLIEDLMMRPPARKRH